MGKRTASEVDPRASQHDRNQKRQRVEHSGVRDSPRPAQEQVTSARQLQKALVFEQGTASGFRGGLSLLKRFLDSILYSTDQDDLPRKRAILREYLESQKNSKGREDIEANFLSNFFQAWEYAVETSFDNLLSVVTANLALLLKALGSHADFLQYGQLLCKAVLQTSIARRLNRSLLAPPDKETVISPILRLLTEITRFDEGAQAKAIYAKRDFTLEPRTLARNLSLSKDSQGDEELDRRKPSIRTNTVRYLLAQLTYQDELAKTDILSNVAIARAVFRHLQFDPPFLILDILDVLKNHVFLDKTIPRHIKSRILTGKNLAQISSLYRYELPANSVVEGRQAPDEAAHEFLCTICTSPAYGVMLPSFGLYPPVNEDDDGDAGMEDAADYATQHSVDHPENLANKRHVRNVILGEFIRSLKPHANILQQELIIKVFESCPELVAHYFLNKEAFSYDPKLTSTWIGYSSFLYQTIEIPVPQNLTGRRLYREHPPAASVVIQSILPQPLTQQVLTKCLNTSSELVNFFAVRVLVVAFKKLRSVLREYSSVSQSTSSKAWEQGAKRLITEFCQRCPPMKTVTLAFKRPAFQKNTVREAVTRLLRLYFEVTPQVALQEKFDVSIPLCNALIQTETSAQAAENKAFRVLELEHWIQIARHSPSMRWWQKTKTLPHSPFVTLLKLVVTSSEAELYNGVRPLLVTILQSQDMLQMTTYPTALDALLASLTPSCGSSSPSAEVLEFLDDCCARFIKGPIKYFDDLDTCSQSIQQHDSSPAAFSPLLMTLVEQWPFKGSKAEKGNPADPLAQWLSKFLYLLKLVGEDEALLELVRDSLVSSADQTYQQVLKDAFLWKMGKQKAKEALKLATGADFSGSERSSTSPIPAEQLKERTKEQLKDMPEIDLELPPKEDEKHAGLNRWRKKDIEESIDSGDIGELLLCLCSKHAEIRLQAAINIRQLMAKIDVDEDSDLLQLKLVLGGALETAQSLDKSDPLPYVGGVFAARAVAVLADPTHFMFGKINKFLLKRPDWLVADLPRYFSRTIINSEPGQDDSYHKEVGWFLDYLIDCLRTAGDMEIFRTRNMFERLLSHYLSPSCAISAKEKIVRLLLRATAVGGSTTLITRCGLLSWIQMRLDSNDHRHRTLRLLASRLWETCDQSKVGEWSSGMVGEAIAMMVKTELIR